MNADNLMSINCNRVDRNQFLDELTGMTAFSARQLAKYTNSIFVSQIYRNGNLSGKERASKIIRLRPICDEATKIIVLRALQLTRGQRCRANQPRLRSTIKVTAPILRADRYLVSFYGRTKRAS